MILTALLVMLALPTAADAVGLKLGRELCYAVTAPSPTPVPPAQFHCAGEPTGYQRATLQLRAGLSRVDGVQHGAVLLLHLQRFERLAVSFGYADGYTDRQEVRRGNYGAHWRIGGVLAFEAPARPAALTSVTLAFDHLATHRLLLMRILSGAAANRDLATVAVLAGGSLMLLLAAGIYNLSLAIAVRRQFPAWHGIWALCVCLWGFFWSQTALLVFPGLAGTPTNQICTFLACLAIMMATISAVSALGDHLPRPALRGVIALGASVAALGIPGALATGKSIDTLGTLLNTALLADLCAVALCIAWAWRRGSSVARDLAFAWGVPMAILAASALIEFDDWPFGGGSYIAVLFASALQIIWLSIGATRRLSTMRVELDAARAAESALAELASRDPLTGLLNRRGFVDRIQQAFAGGNEAPFGLLLIDVDQFKAINDQFGHEAGDAVLCRIAGYLRRLERELCLSGRMGGEEFVVGVSGLTSFALGQFAERVRTGLAACDHGDVTRHRVVTVSVGVAEGTTLTPFQKLYGAADRALYDAKRSGRDKVVFHSGSRYEQNWGAVDRDQLSFNWPAP